MKKTNASTNKKKYSDVIARMRGAYNRNKDQINDKPSKQDNPRQRKIDDLQNRSHSWKGLRERLSNAIQRQEEYDYGEPRVNPFMEYTWEEVCDMMETANEKELDKFMDACNVDNIDNLWDYINSCFTIEEA